MDGPELVITGIVQSWMTLSLIGLWFYNFLTPNALILTLRELSLWVYPTLSAMTVRFLRSSTLNWLRNVSVEKFRLSRWLRSTYPANESIDWKSTLSAEIMITHFNDINIIGTREKWGQWTNEEVWWHLRTNEDMRTQQKPSNILLLDFRISEF